MTTRTTPGGPGSRRVVVHAATLALAGSLVLATSAGAATAPRFKPHTTHAGDRVQISAHATAGQSLHVYLASKRKPGKHDVGLGKLKGKASGTASRAMLVPLRTHPGRYYVLACHAKHADCTSSHKKLTVLARRKHHNSSGGGGGGGGGAGGSGPGGGNTGPGSGGSPTDPGDYKYIVNYTHSDSASYIQSSNTTFFIGTTDFAQSFDLSSSIPVDGDPITGTATGTGTIDYTDAAYHYNQDGSFQSQGGQAGTSGACNGSDHTTLTSTTPGAAAQVVGLHITASSITLDFRPGPLNGTGTPSESYHNVQTYDACPGADNTDTNPLFLNTFANFHDLRGDEVGFGSGAYVHLTSGWQLGTPDEPNVVATLTITGPWNSAASNSTYTDHFEIQRVPDQG